MGFSLQVLVFEPLKQEITSAVPQMDEGRDMRNKVTLFNDQIYSIGGNMFKGQKLDI
jgi:hypothetical protein